MRLIAVEDDDGDVISRTAIGHPGIRGDKTVVAGATARVATVGIARLGVAVDPSPGRHPLSETVPRQSRPSRALFGSAICHLPTPPTTVTLTSGSVSMASRGGPIRG